MVVRCIKEVGIESKFWNVFKIIKFKILKGTHRDLETFNPWKSYNNLIILFRPTGDGHMLNTRHMAEFRFPKYIPPTCHKLMISWTPSMKTYYHTNKEFPPFYCFHLQTHCEL